MLRRISILAAPCIASIMVLASCATKAGVDPKQAFITHRKSFVDIVTSLDKDPLLHHILVYPEINDSKIQSQKPAQEESQYARQGVDPAVIITGKRLIKDIGLSYIEAAPGEVIFVFPTATPLPDSYSVSNRIIRYYSANNAEVSNFAEHCKQPEFRDSLGRRHKIILLDQNWFLQLDYTKN